MDGWFGDTVQFGARVRYVCDRNTQFEDPDMAAVEFRCEGEGEARGYFNVPAEARSWPRCVRTVSCGPPPDPPEDGSLVTIPPVYSVQSHTACGLPNNLLRMSCPSFLSILILTAEYGRYGQERILCDGSRAKAPQDDCISEEHLDPLQEQCHGDPGCVLTVPDNKAVCGRGYTPQLLVTYTCTSCHPWHLLLQEEDQCVANILMHLKRISLEQLSRLSEDQLMAELRLFIKKRLNKKVYTDIKLQFM